MSQTDTGGREVAYRLFATEYDEATLSYSESDEDRAPNYVVTPTGARVNRLFLVGVLTEVEAVSEDVLRARVVDPTGAFVLYAGQYQPDEQVFLETVDPPTFVAVTGKARTFQPDDADRVYTSVRPESINEVDAETRDRWVVQATEQTLARVQRIGRALTIDAQGDELRERLIDRGMDEGLASGIPLALDHYDTTPTYLGGIRDLALDATRVVAGDRSEVRDHDVDPDAGGTTTARDLIDLGDIDTAALLTQPTDSAAETDEDEVDETGGTVMAQDEPEDVSPASAETASTATENGTPASMTVPEEDEDAKPAESTQLDEVGDFEAEEFDLDDEIREEVQEEYGTEFQSGTEVEEPGSAGIETPEGTDRKDTDDTPESSRDSGDSDGSLSDASETTRTADTATMEVEADDATDASEADSGESGDVEDVQAAVVGVMQELDDGSGADRESVVGTMADRHGIDEADVEDAIQDALMDGQCYEPDETSLKPI